MDKRWKLSNSGYCPRTTACAPFAFVGRNHPGGRWRLNGVLQHGDGLMQVEDMQTALDERGNQVTTLQQKLDAREQELNDLKRKNDRFREWLHVVDRRLQGALKAAGIFD